MKLWGGNYDSEPDRQFWAINRSLPFDSRLLAEEIAASRAYVRALGRCGVLSSQQEALLDRAHDQAGRRSWTDSHDGDEEDVHTWVEARVHEVAGSLAGQAHLGRSRNEQAVTALRLFVRAAIDRLRKGISSLVETLAEQGRAHVATVMPGYTHSRPAEPITFAHWAACHAWALARDFERLRDTRVRVNILPLGSGALAGTALPLDRLALASDLGFDSLSENALDAVTDRDFAAEFVFCCAQLQTHLGRLAEDLIRFSGPEMGFVELPEAFTTGSSLMPQKKNPDALELVRGKAARVDGDLLRLLVLMKGLPSGYQKDLQEDKQAVFDAADTVEACLAVTRGVVAGLVVKADVMRRAAGDERLMAAGLTVALAQEGTPFREAHRQVGALVAEAGRTGLTLRRVLRQALAPQSQQIAARLEGLLDPDQAVRAKACRGGTAPEAALASLEAVLKRVRSIPAC